MEKTLLAALAVSALSGCQTLTPEQLAEYHAKIQFIDVDKAPVAFQIGISSLESSLKDPDSMKLKNALTYTDTNNEIRYCVEFNAKNSYGGYAGYEWAFITDTGDVSTESDSMTYRNICSGKVKYAIQNQATN